MFTRSHIYTIHENALRRDPADRLELVREGFSVGALLLGSLWLLLNRLWLPALAMIAAMLALQHIATRAGLSPATVGVLQMGGQFWLGCYANDIKRWVLERRGYVMRGVVCAESPMMAQRRVLEQA